jgi:hypothetical protein
MAKLLNTINFAAKTLCNHETEKEATILLAFNHLFYARAIEVRILIAQVIGL